MFNDKKLINSLYFDNISSLYSKMKENGKQLITNSIQKTKNLVHDTSVQLATGIVVSSSGVLSSLTSTVYYLGRQISTPDYLLILGLNSIIFAGGFVLSRHAYNNVEGWKDILTQEAYEKMLQSHLKKQSKKEK